ncbi:uncharacterized protein LOC124133627 [Haliotis rufescens]|uniref:uncharacterized protein LOC124133627 n=1 Tax=Haliotis rufescens TaxID=6454 RepID=UPI00201EA379|nr:uncharacterized protein LOC124133627 [Haliotis rufescens]
MHRAVGYTLHGTILVLCVLNIVLLTYNNGIYNLYHDDLSLTVNGVNLSGYLMKPDVPFSVHVLLLLVGGFIPGVTGLGLITVNKRMSSNVRLVHVVSAVGGTICGAVLMVTEATSIHEINGVSCSRDNYWGSCGCGYDFIFGLPINAAVCEMRDVRITYLAVLCLSLICDVISLVLTNRMGKDLPDTKSKITRVMPIS